MAQWPTHAMYRYRYPGRAGAPLQVPHAQVEGASSANNLELKTSLFPGPGKQGKQTPTAKLRGQQERCSWVSVYDDPARPRDCFTSPKAFSRWGKVFYPFREFLRPHCFFVSLMSLTVCSLDNHYLIDVLEISLTD